MFASLRWASPLLALAAAFVALIVARPAWLRPAASRASSSSLLAQTPEKSRILQDRIAAKNAVADRLLAGEMDLAEAAAWFRHLNDNPPSFPSHFRDRWPGVGDGEKLCRQIIHWVKVRLQSTRAFSEADVVAHELEADLAALLARDGTVELPW